MITTNLVFDRVVEQYYIGKSEYVYRCNYTYYSLCKIYSRTFYRTVIVPFFIKVFGTLGRSGSFSSNSPSYEVIFVWPLTKKFQVLCLLNVTLIDLRQQRNCSSSWSYLNYVLILYWLKSLACFSVLFFSLYQ